MTQLAHVTCYNYNTKLHVKFIVHKLGRLDVNMSSAAE